MQKLRSMLTLVKNLFYECFKPENVSETVNFKFSNFTQFENKNSNLQKPLQQKALPKSR